MPQFKPFGAKRESFKAKRPQSPAQVAAGEISRRVIKTLGLKDETATWRAIRAVVLEYVEPTEPAVEAEPQA